MILLSIKRGNYQYDNCVILGQIVWHFIGPVRIFFI